MFKDQVRLYSENGCSETWDSMLGLREFYIPVGGTVTVKMPKRAMAQVGEVRRFEDWFYADIFSGNAFDFPWEWS